MKLITTTRWHKVDWGIIISSFFLVLISLAILYSLELNQLEPNFSLLKHQALAAILGLVCFLAFLFIDYRFLKDYAYLVYGTGIIILIWVLLFGVTIRGTKGWLSFVDFTFQPVELFKLILVITLAKFYSTKITIYRIRSLINSFLFILPPAILIFLQPDWGSLIVLAVTGFGFLFVMRLRRLYILIFILAVIIISLLSWQFLLAPYQKERILTFINPSVDMSGAGYNVEQSKIAIGSGRVWGRGLALGTQSSLNFLPEQATDFIFAVVAESLGFLGGGLLIILYFFLLWRILNLTNKLRDEFGIFLALGVFFWFSFQGLINIAMNLGLAPVLGVPLPLVSYGGSSLLVSLIAIGLLQSVCIYSPRDFS